MVPPNADHVTTGAPESDLYFMFLFPWHNYNQSIYDIHKEERGPISPAPQGTVHKNRLHCDEQWVSSNHHPELGLRRFLSISLESGQQKSLSPNEQIIQVFIWKGHGTIYSGT